MEKKKKKKIKYVTLIWEELPESISIYLIPRRLINRDDAKMLNMCHNRYINTEPIIVDGITAAEITSALCRLNNILIDPKLDWIDDQYKHEQAEYCNMPYDAFCSVLGKWNKFKIDRTNPISRGPACPLRSARGGVRGRTAAGKHPVRRPGGFHALLGGARLGGRA